MKVLTDTHTLVWAISNRSLLSAQAFRAMSECEVVASVVNLWELSLKAGKKDSLVADPIAWWRKYVIQTRIPTLGIRIKQWHSLNCLRFTRIIRSDISGSVGGGKHATRYEKCQSGKVRNPNHLVADR